MRATLAVARSLPIILALVAGAPLEAQDFDASLRPLVGENAERYAGPVSEGLGWTLGQPVVDDAHALPSLDFEVSARIVAALPPGATTSYEPVAPSEVTYGGETFTEPYAVDEDPGASPTAVARGQGARLEPVGEFRDRLVQEGHDPDDFAFRLPDGLNMPAVAFPVAQGSVGVGFGTEVTGRYTPRVRLGDNLGRLGSRGLAATHEVTHWFPDRADPLSVAVEGGRTSFDVGDALEGSASHLGVAVSGTAGILTVFGQAGFQRSSVDVRYTAEAPPLEGAETSPTLPVFPGEGEEVSFTSTVDTSPRFSAGALFQFYVLRLSTHFTLANFNAVSVKLGVGPP